MKTSRMEAFSDGVLAIIITIMVLELKVPHETDLASLRSVFPVFGSYVLSFISASTGTTIIIYCTSPRTSVVKHYGRTCICCFGCH